MMQIGSLKSAVKRQLKLLHRAGLNEFFAFDSKRLYSELRRLGLQTGDTIFVHCAFDAFGGYRGSPSEVIQILEDCVGSEGLLMMPTMAFTGSALEVARSDALFDVLRTPSRMGMISELFRRSPGVVRSVHPTHSVACWGANAAAVAQGHHLSETPCGRGTPYEELLQRRGKVVLLGTDISVLTFYHHLEEKFEKELPESPFTEEVFTLRSKAADGKIVETHCRLYAPDMSRRRNLHKLVPYLKRQGAWREGRVGRLKIAVLPATGAEAAIREMNQRGIYCYE